MVLRYYVSYSNYVCKQFDYLKIAVKWETMFKFVIIQLYCKVMVILQKFNEYEYKVVYSVQYSVQYTRIQYKVVS